MRDAAPTTWILWIHASNAGRFELSIRDTLEQLKVPGWSEPKANVFQLFRSWLRDEQHGRWLIVLDNADNVSFLVEPPHAARQTQDGSDSAQSGERCIDYLPQCSHGSMIVTSRSSAAALKIVDQKGLISVGPMDEGHAVTLIEKKLEGRCHREEVLGLARAVDLIPLAMAQAAAYIRQRAPRCTVQQYVEKLEKNDKSRLSLLNRHEEDLRRDREASNSIIQTWEISFEHIREIRPSAADLLCLMSFFDNQAIPEALLRERDNDTEDRSSGDTSDGENNGDAGHDCDLDESDSDGDSTHNAVDDTSDIVDEAFEEDVAVLQSYSFVTAGVSTFQMHRLVQVATRTWLESHGQHERWGSQFVKNLADAFPFGAYEDWATCEPLFPHAMMALELRLVGTQAMIDQGVLMINSARFAQEKGVYAIAEKMGELAMRTLKQALGEGHPDWLSSINNLAITYSARGRWEEAEKLEILVVEARKKVLGKTHLDTLISINNLASTYWSQGRWEEAEELEIELLRTRRKVLGETHPDTLISMSNLASTFRDQGRWEEAEKLDIEVLASTLR